MSRLGEDFFKSVEEMMIAFRQLDETGAYRSRDAKFPTESVRELRRRLLDEEYLEYVEAEALDDLVEVADALADIFVIAAGTALAYRIDLPQVLGEVMRSNMSKIDLETGRVLHRSDGKVLKPPTYSPPEVKEVM